MLCAVPYCDRDAILSAHNLVAIHELCELSQDGATNVALHAPNAICAEKHFYAAMAIMLLLPILIEPRLDRRESAISSIVAH